MPQVNSQHALQEFLENMERRDLIKARLVLDCFPQLDPQAQRRMLFELSRQDDQLTLPLLISLAARHPALLEQYPALTETIDGKARHAPACLVRLLREPRLTAAELAYAARLAGARGLGETVPALLALLGQGNSALDEPLAVALGQIGTDEALTGLAQALGRGEAADQYLLATIAASPGPGACRVLSQVMATSHAGRRKICKDLLRGLGPRAVPQLLANLEGTDPDLQIHTLNLLGEIGDPRAVAPIRRLLSGRPTNANLRFAAYEALASLPGRPAGDYVLAAGLGDAVEDVRLAAAKAIDPVLNETMLSGIANLVDRADAEAASIVRAILDAQAPGLLLGLRGRPFFREIGWDYLGRRAHPEVRDFALRLLLAVGENEAAQHIRRLAETSQEKAGVRPVICAVDDSQMVLAIYRRLLTELGFAPKLFADPRQALDWLNRERPLALCTDLNMPGLTGLELTAAVRRRHSPAQLPILMVTTQDDQADHEAARRAGVTAIMDKPFDVDKLRRFLLPILGGGTPS